MAWSVLGVARLHHLLATGRMASKSEAGRYVANQLDEQWRPIGLEALRARERPDEPSRYRSANLRGRDVRDFVAWCVADGARLAEETPRWKDRHG
ncbi:aminoglycoside adenylyltransferase domain-containing protein [Luteococcus sp. Sow4_B9]|uniref:aminoglycoside adenylyltransferase domain-containing protein n=1 Tax=Luteococcus sp. Sow4_B9 TaxID=3438792 RepID=UPI003F9DAC27